MTRRPLPDHFQLPQVELWSSARAMGFTSGAVAAQALHLPRNVVRRDDRYYWRAIRLRFTPRRLPRKGQFLRICGRRSDPSFSDGGTRSSLIQVTETKAALSRKLRHEQMGAPKLDVNCLVHLGGRAGLWRRLFPVWIGEPPRTRANCMLTQLGTKDRCRV